MKFFTLDLFVASGTTGDPSKEKRTSSGPLARLVTVLVIELGSTLGVIMGVAIPDLMPGIPTWLAGVSGTTAGCGFPRRDLERKSDLK